MSRPMAAAAAGHDSRSHPERPRRADARRNYGQLIEQARLAFAEYGVDASLDEIARRAGVASGTLYRHFPTRLDLIEAVLAGQIAELADLGRGLLAAEDEFDALSTWLRATVRHALTYRGLSAAVLNSALDRGNSLVEPGTRNCSKWGPRCWPERGNQARSAPARTPRTC